MKICLHSLVVLVICGVNAWGSPTAPTEEIRQVIVKQQDAWNRGDLEAFMAGYWNSAELTFFSGARESKGWQAALDRFGDVDLGPVDALRARRAELDASLAELGGDERSRAREIHD